MQACLWPRLASLAPLQGPVAHTVKVPLPLNSWNSHSCHLPSLQRSVGFSVSVAPDRWQAAGDQVPALSQLRSLQPSPLERQVPSLARTPPTTTHLPVSLAPSLERGLSEKWVR